MISCILNFLWSLARFGPWGFSYIFSSITSSFPANSDVFNESISQFLYRNMKNMSENIFHQWQVILPVLLATQPLIDKSMPVIMECIKALKEIIVISSDHLLKCFTSIVANTINALVNFLLDNLTEFN